MYQHHPPLISTNSAPIMLVSTCTVILNTNMSSGINMHYESSAWTSGLLLVWIIASDNTRKPTGFPVAIAHTVSWNLVGL